MSSDTKADSETTIKTEESGGQNGIKKENNTDTEKKALTFKDWKSLKASQNNVDKNPETSKNNLKTKKNFKDSRNNIKGSFNNNGFGIDSTESFNRGQNFQSKQNFFGGNNFGNNGNCGIPPLMPPPSFNNLMIGSNSFNDFPSMNFNNFNGGRNMNNTNFNGRNNFPNGFNNDNFNGGNNFPSGFNNNFNSNFNGPNLPDSFFASDGIYRQRDMMQRALSSSDKYHNKEFGKPIKYNRTGDKQKGEGGNKQQEGENSNLSKAAEFTQNGPKINTEPKIFVPNPQRNSGVVPYIPKPRLPDENPDMTFEERKKAWKEYRQAMKPFKNREFYNARRVVQRLGKKDPQELGEKEILRLANAREVMASHKERLAAKYGNYTKAEESSTALGELYVLKKKPLKDWDKGSRPMKEKQFHNYGNFGENQQNNGFGPGRKIVGGYSGFTGFVQGGMLEGSVQQRF